MTEHAIPAAEVPAEARPPKVRIRAGTSLFDPSIPRRVVLADRIVPVGERFVG